MGPIKKFVNNQIINFYFYKTTYKRYDDARFWIIPAIFLINSLEINIYIKCILCTCALLYKLYTDTLVTDRLLSVLISIVAVFLNFRKLPSLGVLMFVIIVQDTIWYHKTMEKRRLKLDYFTISKNLSSIREIEEYDNFDINKDDDDEADDEVDDDDDAAATDDNCGKVFIENI